MTPNRFTAFLVLLTLVAALFNSPLFGPETYTAFFLFTICASFTTAIIQLKLVTRKKTISYTLPVILFCLFCMYVVIHGLITHTMGIFHYYCITGGLLFLSLHSQREPGAAIDHSFLHYGISVIAFIESLIVLLQAIHVLPGLNNFFAATGTWVNPNVTATFLALSLYSIHSAERLKKNKGQRITALVTVLLAIILLQCRTAYIVTLLQFFPLVRPLFSTYLSSRFPVKRKFLLPVILVAGSVLFIVYVLSVKNGSTSGRLLIWENSTDLIQQSPVTGHGFGLFEKSYNEYVANNGLASNGYVKMAYNDFIELSVEGGFIASLLWAAFIISYLLYCRKNNYSVLPLVCLVIIQLSNFVFQAVPVFAILIVYLALPASYQPTARTVAAPQLSIHRNLFYFGRAATGLTAVIAGFLLYHHLQFAFAFYKVNNVEKFHTANAAPSAYQQLEEAVLHNAYLHEKSGDAFMKTRQIKKALEQYQSGLQTIYPPSLLVKSGFCYQLQKKYDSSLHYFRLAQHIEPYKFATQHVILRMFEQKKDTANIIATAKVIVNMPVKVESRAVFEMKSYAQKTINKMLTR